MEPIRRALRKSLVLAVIMTLLFPLGGVLLGVGLGIGFVPMWAFGIACLAVGFYGCPIAWTAGYAPKKGC